MANVYGFKMWVEAPQLNGNENDKEIIKNYENEVATKLYSLLIQGGLKFKLDEYSGHIITDVVDGVSTDYMVGSLTNGVHLIILETSQNQKYNGSSKLTRKEIVKMLDGLDPVFENVKPIKVNDSESYEFINVVIDPINQPIAYQNRVDSLVNSGFSLEDAKAEALMPIEMELYFDPNTSLIMIDSGAIESGVGYNPYTGIELDHSDDDNDNDNEVSSTTLNIKSYLFNENNKPNVTDISIYVDGVKLEVEFSDFVFNDNEYESKLTIKGNPRLNKPCANIEIKSFDFFDSVEINAYIAQRINQCTIISDVDVMCID